MIKDGRHISHRLTIDNRFQTYIIQFFPIVISTYKININEERVNKAKINIIRTDNIFISDIQAIVKINDCN